MAVVGQAVVEVRPNLAPFKRDVERGLTATKVKPVKVDGDTRPLTGKLGGVKTAIAGLATGFAAIKAVGFFKSSIDAASDLNESLSKTRVVFGSSAREVERFARTSASSLGISRQAALESTSTFGNLLTALKIGKAPAADMSQSIVKLGSDLASFNNVDPAEALEALRAGLVGETEPLRRFGVNLNDAQLRQKALALGLVKTTKEVLPPAARAQAAYALIMEQTKTAQGDFARTSAGLANQQRILSARFTDLKAKLGTALLPVVLKVVGALNTMLGFLMREGPPAIEAIKAKFAELQATLAPFIARLQEIGARIREQLPSFAQVVATLDRFKVAIAAAIAVFVGFRTVVSIIQGVRAAIIALNLALAANPIVLVALALAALAAAFVIAYQRSAEFRAVVQQALATVQGIAQQLVSWITGTFVPALVGAFNAVAQTWQQNSARIQANLRSFLSALQTVWGWIRGPALTIVRATFTAIATIIRAQIKIVQNVIQLVLNVLAGRWGAAWGNLKTIASTALRAVVSVVTGVGGALLSAAGQLAGKILTGMKNKLADLPNAVRTLLAKLPGAMLGLGGAFAQAAFSLGSKIVQGALNGVGSLAGALKSKIESMARSALSSLNPFSPVEHGGEIYIGNPLVAGALKGVTTLAPRLKNALSSAVRDAVQQAKQNLSSLSGSLASSLNQLLDAKLDQGPAAANLRKAQQAQADLDFQRQRDQLQATIGDAATSDEDRAKAQADLDVLLAQHAYDLEQRKTEAAKAANERQLADLAEALNRGLITQKDYAQKVQALLKAQGADYKSAGQTLGLAFADGFLAQIKDVISQAAAIAKSGLPGQALTGNVVDPLSQVRAELRDARSELKDRQKAAREKSSAGGTKVTAGEAAAIKRQQKQVDLLEALLAAMKAISTTANVQITTDPNGFLAALGLATGDAAR